MSGVGNEGNCNTIYAGTATDGKGYEYNPLTNNLMSYAPSECRTSFTNEQIAVMEENAGKPSGIVAVDAICSFPADDFAIRTVSHKVRSDDFAIRMVSHKFQSDDFGIVNVISNTYSWVDLERIERNGKYGFIDKSGNTKIPFIYRYAGNFYEGLARVRKRKNSKYGFIDESGNTKISFIYDDAKPFYGGLARVKKNGKYGFIDKSGNTKIPLIYDHAMNFSDGLAEVSKQRRTLFRFRRPFINHNRKILPYKHKWRLCERL